MSSHVRQDASVGQRHSTHVFLCTNLFAHLKRRVFSFYIQKSSEELVQPQWRKPNAIHPYRLIYKLTVLLMFSFQQRLCHMEFLDSYDVVLVGYRVFNAFVPQNIQRENNLRRKHSTHVLFVYVCAPNIFKFAEENQEGNRNNISVHRNWLPKFFPFMFIPILSIQPSGQQVSILYLLYMFPKYI